jgi:dipeptidyl-peptidase-3
VGIHELLGHGTGKLFQENAKGEKNFPADFIHPLTGQPLSTWYKPGETWDSKVIIIFISLKKIFFFFLLEIFFFL